MGWAFGVRFLTRAKDINLLSSGETGPRAHPASYPMDISSSIVKSKAAGAWTYQLTAIYWRGQEKWNCASTPPYTFVSWCLINSADYIIGILNLFSSPLVATVYFSFLVEFVVLKGVWNMQGPARKPDGFYANANFKHQVSLPGLAYGAENKHFVLT
jgi:hypothetical protein